MDKEKKLIDKIIPEAEKILKDEGLTQSEYSKKLGTKQASISRFLNGKTNPSLEWVENFFNGLGYEIDVVIKKKE